MDQRLNRMACSPPSQNESRPWDESSAADGTKKDGSEIGVDVVSPDQHQSLQRRHAIAVKLRTRTSDLNGVGRGGRMGVHNDRSSSPVEGGIRQVDVRQDHDQQHQKDEAAEQYQRRRVDLPLRHVFILFCQRLVLLSMAFAAFGMRRASIAIVAA